MSKIKKWTSITQETKKKVYERDNGRCIFCGSPNGLPEAHYIPRSKLGSGGERNIVTACRYTCHKKLDSGTPKERETYRLIIRNHLKKHYDNWNEEDLIYKKGVSL